EDRIYSNYEAESIGDFAPVLFQPSTSIKEEDVSFCPPTIRREVLWCFTDREYIKNVVNKPALHESYTDVNMRDSSCMSCEETEPTSTKQSIHRNQYLAIQDACDKTSMLAYNVS
ncbi:hypothetical protein S83_041274, partial [Arachis hypogaea]